MAEEPEKKRKNFQEGWTLPADASVTLKGRAYDAAGDLPGTQLNDPDEIAEAGVHTHRLRPKRRGKG